MMPAINVRDTLGDFVKQYTGYAQITQTLGLAGGRPQQTLANPYPANKTLQLGPRYRVEARVEAYNAFNTIVWDNPEINLASSNFGKVTRKRTDGQGREVDIGVRFAF